MKIANLVADMRNVDVRFRVISKGETREINSRDGKTLNLSEVEVGDETGRIYLTLWNSSIDLLEIGEIAEVKNGFIKVVRDELRLNVGKYGELQKVEDDKDFVEEKDIPNEFKKPPEDYQPPYKKRYQKRR
ncbi:MAG: single-stranded DNA-binding protein [Asgard group archaeon]|nr:single-stranded DNA-binding protein [Asgard group archaeon]